MVHVDLDTHDEAGVHLARCCDGLDDSGQLFGGNSRGQVDGIGGRRGGWGQPGDLLLQGRRQHWYVEAAGVCGIGAEDEWSADVADEGDPAPGRRRVTVEEQPDIHQLLQGVRSQHAGVGEQGVDGRLVAGEGGGVRLGAASSRRGPSTLQRDDGLAPGDRASHPGEADRVSERFEVEQHHVRRSVVCPQAQQVVSADIGLVAH